MKTLFCMALAIAMLVMLSPNAKALFGHTAVEKERRLQTEQQLAQEQQRSGSLIDSNEHLHVIITILSAGAVVMLLIGTAIGSKTKSDHDAHL